MTVNQAIARADRNIYLHVVCEECRVGLQDVGQVDFEFKNDPPRRWDHGCCVCGDPVDVVWQVMVADEKSAAAHFKQRTDKTDGQKL